MIRSSLSTLAVTTVPEVAPDSGGGGFGAGLLADLGGFVLLALLIIVVIAVVVKLQKGVEAMQGQAAEAESRFAEELAKIARASVPKTGAAAAPPPVEIRSDAPVSAELPMAEGERPSSRSSGVMRNPATLQKVESLQELANNLYGLRVITDLEGRVALALPPEGLIYRLRRGGACLLLPRLENAETMEHFCKRFELVFVLTTSGEVLVIERKQSRIVDLTERSSSGLPKF